MSAPEVEVPASAVGVAEFRAGMALLGAAVTVIATDGPGGRAGFTASAVCSVTDAPPTLLVCLNRSASVYPAFVANEALSVNVLAPRHERLSRLFGGRSSSEERFAEGSWETLETGAPVLADASVAFDTRIQQRLPVGSHDILICRVAAVRRHPDVGGLVYFDRKYHHLEGG